MDCVERNYAESKMFRTTVHRRCGSGLDLPELHFRLPPVVLKRNGEVKRENLGLSPLKRLKLGGERQAFHGAQLTATKSTTNGPYLPSIITQGNMPTLTLLQVFETHMFR
jgi:hypothetical protein